MLANLVTWLNNVLNVIISAVISVLPQSPFANYDWGSFDVTGLHWLNWFVPVGQMLTLLTAWAAAVASYYVVMAILRKAGFIGS